MRAWTLSEDQREEILRDYGDHSIKIAAIAAKHNVSASYVGTLARRRNLPKRQRTYGADSFNQGAAKK